MNSSPSSSSTDRVVRPSPGSGNKSVRITQKTAKGLRPRSKAWFVRDTELKGFAIKVNPSGNHVYRVEARLGGSGKVVNTTIGPIDRFTVREARNMARDQLRDIRTGINPNVAKREKALAGTTLQQMLDQFLADRGNLKDRTKINYRYLIDHYLKSWLKRPVDGITESDVREWYRKGSTTPTQTDMIYRVLRSILNYAVGLKVIKSNPCQIISNTKIAYSKNVRHDYIDLEKDIERFLEALLNFHVDAKRKSQKTSVDWLVLVLTTGLRSREAKELRWKDIDWDKKVLVFPDTKNRRDHQIPMTRLIYSMLKERQSQGGNSEFVFPNMWGTGPLTDVRRTMKRICENAGTARTRPHDLRRTFASILNEIGVGVADTKALMNHKDANITLKYIQIRREKLRTHLEGVVQFLDSKLPIFEVENVPGQIADGGLRWALYRKGEPSFDYPPTPEPPPGDDEEWE